MVAVVVSVEDGFDACLADAVVGGVEPEWFACFEVCFVGAGYGVVAMSGDVEGDGGYGVVDVEGSC